MRDYPMIIDGKPTTSGKFGIVVNPANETPAGRCALGNGALLDEAVAAARIAFKSWSATSDESRAAALRQAADTIAAHREELSRLITHEQGKTQSGPGANLEIDGCIGWTQATAALALTEEVLQDDAKGKISVRRKPVGVVGSITPWNWPLMIAVWHIMPALRAGCTIVIKPSPYTPLSTLRLVELLNEVFPPGVLNVVTGDTKVGQLMVEHRGIDKIVFTGSIRTGRGVMSGAAATLKRVTLELGGNDAGILLPGSKVTPLLDKLFWGCFLNAGQTCAALKRLYVHEDQYHEVCEQLAAYVSKIPVGDGSDPKNLIGPLTNAMQRDKVAHLVDDAKRRGAKILIGGTQPTGRGYFYPLTVVADATDDMGVVKEEQFGPVIPVLKYKTVEEAVTRANSLDVGLGGSVWGDDAEECAKVAARLECGTAWVNQHGVLHPLAPFGGVKSSGIGVEFNVDGLKEYTTVQVINIAR